MTVQPFLSIKEEVKSENGYTAINSGNKEISIQALALNMQTVPQ